VQLAARGLRDMDGGPEPVASPEVAEQAKRQARSVHGRSLAWALVATAAALLIGG